MILNYIISLDFSTDILFWLPNTITYDILKEDQFLGVLKNMSFRKAKSAPKVYLSDQKILKDLVISTMKRISDVVGGTMGPSGRVVLIESDMVSVPDSITKDGVSVFKALGAHNAYEHAIIGAARDAAQKTSNEAGDGTTTATVLSYGIVENLYKFCDENPKYSPQRAVRYIAKATRELLIPYIRSRAKFVNGEDDPLLHMVAKVSANGDSDIADAVVKAFRLVGFGESSHVTIRQQTGDPHYEVELIDGFPMPIGYEESIGKLHTAFINDHAKQRIYLKKPLFVLFDGQLNDLGPLYGLFTELSNLVSTKGKEEYRNIVLVAHAFSESVISNLAFSWSNADTLNIVPLRTPMAQFLNSQTNTLHDLAAFTGAKVFGLKDPIQNVAVEDLGSGMEEIEIFRFRTNVVGDPDPTNIEVRAEDLTVQMESSESIAEKTWLQERIGKITNGIARLTIFGGSSGELKEKHDRVEDAVLSCRSALAHGALPGGCRISIDMALLLSEKLEKDNPAREVLVNALLTLPHRLLDNAGYNSEEIQNVINKLVDQPELVYDIENQLFGNAEELGLFDSTKAVEESLANAVSIASVLGTMGGIVVFPRDEVHEREEAGLDSLHIRNSSLGQD